ncbi:MAG: pyruvate kinase [Deltaproteobacteria bacterium]|nr:pyruvate kinase [Deltaproteobacteria bacterium]
MNRVKIVATIGPSTNHSNLLRSLQESGMDVARVNGSHGDLNWHEKAIALLRKVVPDIPVLFDIPGRKIRIGRLDRDWVVAPLQQVTLTTEDGVHEQDKVPVTYCNLHRDLAPGDTILVDDTLLRLTVVDIVGRDIRCQAKTAGQFRSGKGIHIPQVELHNEFLSNRDRQLIDFATHSGVDFIGLSFVGNASQIGDVRALVGEKGPQIISKIETQEAIDHLDELVKVSDGLMIDRGDLSMETSIESVALLQKQVLSEAQRADCPVIVATEMLQSMVNRPIPTKAEVNDITCAVLDGASALMLSEETAAGRFPVEAVSLMRQVANTASEHLQALFDQGKSQDTESVPQAIGDAISLICRRLKVTKIVAITISGYAASVIASKMPRQPILAVSNDADAARRFNLLRGVKGIHVNIPFSRTNMNHIPCCLEALWKRGDLVEKDLVLVTAVSYPKSGNRMNFIETHRVSDLRESLGWDSAPSFCT